MQWRCVIILQHTKSQSTLTLRAQYQERCCSCQRQVIGCQKSGENCGTFVTDVAWGRAENMTSRLKAASYLQSRTEAGKMFQILVEEVHKIFEQRLTIFPSLSPLHFRLLHSQTVFVVSVDF